LQTSQPGAQDQDNQIEKKGKKKIGRKISNKLNVER